MPAIPIPTGSRMSNGIQERGPSTDMACPNGHANPRHQHFCGDCGIALLPGKVCAYGHSQPDNHKFCSVCAVPIASPLPDDDRFGGRWNLDPTCRHEYRYWDGDTWTEHVADQGAFSVDGVPDQRGPSLPRQNRWTTGASAVGMTAVSALLVAAAFTTLQSIRHSEPSQPSATRTAPLLTPTVPPSGEARPAVMPPTVAPPRLPAVIGSPCRPNSTPGTTADGSAAYCEQISGTGIHVWSLSPGDVPNPFAGGPDPSQDGNPSVAVCMMQTGRSQSECIEYLRRPSDPGDSPQ